MADALVSTLLDKLASTTYQYVAGEVKLVLNVKKEVEEFAWNLKAIESVLEDAERRQMKEANVQNWLDNLKEISYEMVDVLDEWNTGILRQEVEKQDREGADHLAPQRKGIFMRLWYPLSKTLAEKAAWEFANEKRLDVVVVNPGTVMGPVISPRLNASMLMLLRILEGTFLCKFVLENPL